MLSSVRIKQKCLAGCRCLGLISKKNNIDEESLPAVDVGAYSVFAYVSSTNNMLILQGDKKYYFRPCGKHVERDEIIQTIVEDYDGYFGTSLRCKLPVLFENRHEKSKFLNMGTINDNTSRIYDYFKKHDLSVVGINGASINTANEIDFDHFLHFAWSEIAEQNMNVNGGRWNCYRFNRCKAQEILYDLLGASPLICHSEMVSISTKKGKMIGSLMEESEGINPIDFPDKMKNNNFSPLILRDLTILNFLDVLCYERDHRPGNYNVIMDADTRFCSIKAFDNDSSFAFFPLSSVTNSYVGCSPLIRNGVINRQHLDQGFANRILHIKDNEIKNALYPYLNKIQLFCLLIRLHKIQHYLTRTIKVNKSFLIKPEEWNRSMLETECSGKYGKTYYSCLLNWREDNKDEILINQRNVAAKKIDL